MVARSIELVGKLIGGIVGPGGETTGYELQLPDIDLDFGGIERPALVSGEAYLVTGDFQDRWYPLRGRTKVLRVKALLKGPLFVPRARLRDSVFLQGTVIANVIRPGGETTGTVLSGASPQVKLSSADDSQLVNKDVRTRGRFELVSYPLVGPQFVFAATKTTEVKPHKPLTPLLSTTATAAASVDTVVGFSDSFSLEEAVLDAVGQLPINDTPDWLTEVHIDSIDAEFGGIAGLSRLKVSISSPRQP
jgi:hypothetical protein